MDSGQQDQSIKDRKNLLYEDDAPSTATATTPSKPFALYLQETPAAPLPMWVKASLWAVGAIVALLLAGAAMKSPPPKEKPRPKRSSIEVQTSRSILVGSAIADQDRV